MPPLHAYPPELGRYENGSESGSSLGANLATPGSFPLYDPTSIPGIGSANGNYGGIPGLGIAVGLVVCREVSGRIGLGKNEWRGYVKGERTWYFGVGVRPESGMNSLAASYMMTGYALIKCLGRTALTSCLTSLL